MSKTPTFMQVGNWFMGGLLHSPLHPLLSKNLLTITVTGRKTGHTYTTPINYVQDGQHLYATSQRERQWWRNLRGGAPAILRWRGKDVTAQGIVLEEEAAIRATLPRYLKIAPDAAKWLGLRLDATGQAEADDVARFVRERVILVFTLPGA